MNERIKQIRRELGLTQTEFAERIGLKQNSIALIESGKRNISDQAVLSICREYKINEEWLRTGNGEKKTIDSRNQINELATRYALSESDKIFIEKYVHLTPGTRDAVMAFIMDVAVSLSANSSHITNKYENMDSLKETMNVLHGIELQKKAEEKSSLSCGGNTDEENRKNA